MAFVCLIDVVCILRPMDQSLELNVFKQQVSAFYDRRSSSYDAAKLPAVICQQLYNLASLTSGSTVLDIGTGTGRLAFLAAQSVGQTGRVIGVDISPQMLEKAREKTQSLKLNNVEFILADAEHLNFPAQIFDCILCANTFPWMQNKARTLCLWHKFLKPEGTIVVHSPANSAYTGICILRRVLFKYGISMESTNRVGTNKKISRLFASAGFIKLKILSEQHGQYISVESMQSVWDSVVENPSITSPKILNKVMLQMTPSQWREIKAEFFEEISSLNTDKGVWRDLTTLYILGKKSG